MMATECRQILYSLIFNCPFELQCENCPLKSLYQKDIDDRLDYIENLQTSEIEQITDKHYELFQKNYDNNQQHKTV